jgi:cytochrome c oxidase subunit II
MSGTARWPARCGDPDAPAVCGGRRGWPPPARSSCVRFAGLPATAAAVLLLAGCVGSGSQDILLPRGPQAARIADFFWASTAVAALVFVGYCALLAWSLVRSHRRARRGVPNELPASHGWRFVLWGGLVGPSIILLGFIVYSAYTDRLLALLGDPAGGDMVTIQVTGHQFWWEVEYLDPERRYRQFITANEIYIPVGQPVRFHVQTRDVIHSFWIPNLHGKIDMIPPRTNSLVLQADHPGVYRGQCAEFCGIQHAKMAFHVVAVPPAEFAAWWERQLAERQPPLDPVLVRGEEVFMSNGCGICHAVTGTPARGRAGPDLSNFGSRRSLAAGVLPNTRGHLGGWISDPQDIKPGNYMPAVPLDGESLQALISYLHSLR